MCQFCYLKNTQSKQPPSWRKIGQSGHPACLWRSAGVIDRNGAQVMKRIGGYASIGEGNLNFGSKSWVRVPLGCGFRDFNAATVEDHAMLSWTGK
jgi:hypothetical protein